MWKTKPNRTKFIFCFDFTDKLIFQKKILVQSKLFCFKIGLLSGTPFVYEHSLVELFPELYIKVDKQAI